MRKKGAKSMGKKGSGVDLTEGKWSNERHFVETTSKQGFMCQVHVKTTLKITPEQLFGVFSSPDNSHLFRDLGKTVKYKVIREEGSKQTINLEQQAVLKFLAIPFKFSTFLNVDIDYEKMTMDFQLAKWGAMKKFEGGWTMNPVLDGDKIVGCEAELIQDVLPIVVPPFLTGLLTGLATNVVKRLLEDLDEVAQRLSDGEKMGDILGGSKWMDKNEKLRAWRKEMDAKWNATKSHNQVEKGVASDLDSAQESKPLIEDKNEDDTLSGSEEKDSTVQDIQSLADIMQNDEEGENSKGVDAASENTLLVET